MKRVFVLFFLSLMLASAVLTKGAVITVTTTNNAAPPAGQTSLLQALTTVNSGDTIVFNIPGEGPHYLQTPDGGYPLITKSNITINGYSQPGSTPNTNSILAANNAKIKIILDSRNGNHRLMDFAPTSPNDQTGYGDTEAAILGILEATGVRIHGLGFLGVPLVGPNGDVALYSISFAKGASGHVSGCWIGVDVDGQTLHGTADGITGFRYRVRDEANAVLRDILVRDVIVGVGPASTNAPSEFNVIVGIPAIPIIIEGENLRISGNFLGVLPDGLRDVNTAFIPGLEGFFEGHIEIGRAGNNTIIGVDGDGVNDANERNIFGGVVPPDMGGYDHTVEFYGQTPGTNIVVAGNYFGVGVDGQTRFTNGVPALNAAGGSAQYRFGSDVDGVSDAFEGNVVYNNWPNATFTAAPDSRFFDELSATGILSARGNTFVNNNPFPVSPLVTSGDSTFLRAYYSQALADTNANIYPILATNTTSGRLVGSVPVANTNFPVTIVDLYIADPEGIAYGKTANSPDLTNGFVQGKTYVASFVEGSAADRNPAPGEFDFDLSSVNLQGSLLTITANYSKSPAGTRNAITLTSPFSDPVTVTAAPTGPSLSVSRAGNNVTITWTGTGFGLETASTISGPWTSVATTGNSFTTAATGTAFYRLRAQ